MLNGYDSNGFQVPDNTQTALAKEQGGSFTTGLGLSLAIEWARPHSVFTLDAAANGTYYWSRSKDKTQFNIPTWALVYSSQLDSKTSIAVNFTLNYLSQPDYSNAYASQYGGGSSYLTTSSQIDVTRQWARHFSTDTSLGVNLLYYPDGSPSVIPPGNGSSVAGSQLDITFGNAFQFATSTKLTWVVEGRYELQEALSNSGVNSDSVYFLAGLNWIWLQHFTMSVRAGATVRMSDTSSNSTSPYFEFSGNLKTGRHSSLSLNARYGFEVTNLTGSPPSSFNFGLNYSQTLGRRLSATAGISYYHSGGGQFVFSSNTLQAGNSSNTPQVFNSSTSSDGITLTLGLQYQVNTHFSWAAQYTFSDSSSSSGQADYKRSLATLSANWSF
jgi:hypothetical protein